MLQIVLSDAAADQHGLSQALKDFGIPILVALLTSLFTLVVLGRQLRSGHFSQRYDAFRNKRAVAKALLGEITLLRGILELETDPTIQVAQPILYQANLSQIGRLPSVCILPTISFYAYYTAFFTPGSASRVTTVDKLISSADLAIKELAKFVEGSKSERKSILQNIQGAENSSS
ncbi:hypothetical protein GR204_27750 [Rhizobium leguminosarum]|uniref:Uncharacterized protein n=1 Tax=Rhizobium leguminosarum TaxID=384 RepID=A0A6P0BIA6_RHILE|nr:hypothetical protein [Rhizobium leguminosarum]MBY5846454.1 hypothetical protein [Rhizobium leguminosarum]NEI37712.1 hypothetical protein [Rhizobium leguminosarum]NEI44353.1 hypothetical protein [Rhizobium leguminosarum]QND13785.1 hypothetical protein HB775_07745 [Rhizobium leguminosarum bv. trifolii]